MHTILLFYSPYFVSILFLILLLDTTAAAVDNGSSDTCGLATVDGLALSKTTFTCANFGTTTVTLTATDKDSNSATCSVNVTVQDPIAPTAKCANHTVELSADAGAGTSLAHEHIMLAALSI